ncbi:MAG: wax ester/triacylglycerol synthase family O-acyltransferase [Burkholderiaceae bacterium]
MPKRERMSPIDTAWLRMDSPGNLMMIVGVYLFASEIDFARLKSVIEHRMLAHFRFRARVVSDAVASWWEEDEDFDIDQHLIRIALPGKGTQRDFQRLTGQLAGEALDPNRPLWQMHVVDNVEGGQAMIVRIHHSIADGIALLGVILDMTATDPLAADDAAPPSRLLDPVAADESVHGWDALLRPFTDATVKAIDATGGVASRVLQAYGAVLDDPDMVGEAAGEYVRVAAQLSKDIAGIALMEPDTPTSLKGKPSGSKVVAWTDPIDLEEIKAVGYALGCSVNDVLLACVAGALRAYLTERGEPVEGAEMRAMVPVNLRAPSDGSLGNKFGLVPVLLPIGMENPIGRVFEIRDRMGELKHGYTAVLAMGLLGVIGMAPRSVQRQISDMLAAKASAVMTNVPGPHQPLYLAGTKLERVMFWVPQSGSIGMGVSILSYNGAVQFGLVTDKKICREPQQIIDRFRPEFEKLVNAVLLLPWGEAVSPVEAESWLFPDVPGPAPKRPARPHVAAPRPPAEALPPEAAKPAVAPGLRRRPSAFSAARRI